LRAGLLFLIVTYIILASQSPRRRELLSLCGYPFQVMAAVVDETVVDIPDPAENTILTAQLKADAITNRLPQTAADQTIIVAADTIVALDNQMLGKPADAREAESMLRALRGREHEVHTGMVLVDTGTGVTVSAVHTATVHMRPYTDSEISRYIASRDPLDKAGAYAIQHPQFRPVSSLDGCYLGVMGFSICQLLRKLQSFDVPLLANMEALTKAHKDYPCPILADLTLQA
jgi:septum formation protein